MAKRRKGGELLEAATTAQIVIPQPLATQKTSIVLPVDVDGIHFDRLLDRFKQDEICRDLESRGIAIQQIAHPKVQRTILTKLLVSEYWHKQENPWMTWSLINNPGQMGFNVPQENNSFNNVAPPFFYSEVPMFFYQNKIFCCGPIFVAPRQPPVTIVAGYDLKQRKWNIMKTIGLEINPHTAFKHIPITCVYKDCFYMGYSNFQTRKFTLNKLDLQTGELSEVLLVGASYPTSSQHHYVDGVVSNGEMFIVASDNGPLWLHKISLDSGTCEIMLCTGPIPEYACGCSLLYNSKYLCTFSQDMLHIHMLDINTAHWCVPFKLANKLEGVEIRRVAHNILVYGDFLLLVHSKDGFRLNYLDLRLEREWKVMDTFGKRPNRVRSEPSFLLEGNNIYALGGQVGGKNHLLCLPLQLQQKKIRPPPPERSLEKTHFSRMYNDGYEDLAIEFPSSGLSLFAHRFVLAYHSDVFQNMLKNWSDSKLESMKSQHEVSQISRVEQMGRMFVDDEDHMSESSSSKSIPMMRLDPESMEHQIKIVDVSYDTFENLLLYMYDLLDFNAIDDMGELFLAAGKYLLLPLQDMLAERMVNQIDNDLAIPIYRLVGNALPAIKEKYLDTVCKYISMNISAICQVPAFDEMCREEPTLIAKIMQRKSIDSDKKKRRPKNDVNAPNQQHVTDDLFLEHK